MSGAPSVSRKADTRACLKSRAMCSAEPPVTVWLPRSAPCSTRYSTVARSPPRAASCSGVHRFSSGAFTASGSRSSSACTVLRSPSAAASCSECVPVVNESFPKSSPACTWWPGSALGAALGGILGSTRSRPRRPGAAGLDLEPATSLRGSSGGAGRASPRSASTLRAAARARATLTACGGGLGMASNLRWASANTFGSRRSWRALAVQPKSMSGWFCELSFGSTGMKCTKALAKNLPFNGKGRPCSTVCDS
mmetsp:Transcript_3084/g.9017  ORF Transcript_3084/g.9017 Transcript_3084/m.9017 type:complete len:252 (-) Transcript_3084:735-1490(-)